MNLVSFASWISKRTGPNVGTARARALISKIVMGIGLNLVLLYHWNFGGPVTQQW